MTIKQRAGLTQATMMLLVIFSVTSAHQITHKTESIDHSDLQKLYKEKQYFELRDALRDYRGRESTELLFYRGVVANTFNQSKLSIEHLEEYLRRAKAGQDQEKLVASFEMQADNYLKTYQYRKAANAYSIILIKFRDNIDAEKAKDFENELKLWSALARVPPQTAHFYDDSTLKKNREGRIPVNINKQQVAFIFDTGANVSVIKASLARQLGLQIIDASIDVTAIAGNKVKAKLGVARETRIGNVIIRNGVFLVFDDRDLYISEANFQIDGLIGHPIIEALRAITFIGNEEIFIPKTPANVGEQNMCLDGLSPLIAGRFKGERLIFAFDTGASRSVLYPSFYKRYEDEIRSKYKPHVEKVTGAGGYRQINGYLGEDIVIEFAGKNTRFRRIPIHTEPTNERSRYLYGNIGQDLIKQYRKMTVNFEAMSIEFE